MRRPRPKVAALSPILTPSRDGKDTEAAAEGRGGLFVWRQASCRPCSNSPKVGSTIQAARSSHLARIAPPIAPTMAPTKAPSNLATRTPRAAPIAAPIPLRARIVVVSLSWSYVLAIFLMPWCADQTLRLIVSSALFRARFGNWPLERQDRRGAHPSFSSTSFAGRFSGGKYPPGSSIHKTAIPARSA